MTEQEMNKLSDMYEKSENNRETEIRLFGNRNTIIGIVTLISYIRNCINNRNKKDITVSIGKNVENVDFDFIVNNSVTDDLVAKDSVEIN